MTLDLRQFVNDLMQAWNDHDIPRVISFYAPDHEETDIGQAKPEVGTRSVRLKMALYLRAFPDMHVTLDDLLVEGDRAALSWTLRGTHRGVFLRIPPTGRAVSVQGISLITVEAGRVCRTMRVWDMAGLLRCIGLLPEL
jgi:steroid delta-isomerase-like uncharacterized protein